MKNEITMTITMSVTKPQALALTEMFRYWDYLASVGGSRRVAFYVDGDGDFHPHCQITTVPYVRPEARFLEKALIEDDDGNRVYDYDPVAWAIRNEKEKREKQLSEQSDKPQCESPTPGAKEGK